MDALAVPSDTGKIRHDWPESEGRTDSPQFSPVLDDPVPACEGAGMCNHYRKDQKVIKWSVSRIPRVRIPVPVEALPEHTYPKYLAPVVIEEAGERTLVAIRWGVWPFYAKDKPQFLTNARNDGPLTKPTWKQPGPLWRGPSVLILKGITDALAGQRCGRRRGARVGSISRDSLRFRKNHGQPCANIRISGCLIG